MIVTIKEWDGLTITAKLRDNATCEEVLAAALDILSRIYSEDQVIQAYERVEL